VPAITNLVDDLRVIEVDTMPGTVPPVAALGRAASHLQHDLAVAGTLPAPPDRPVASLWARTLALLANGEQALGSAATRSNPAAIVQAHLQLATAGADLLQVGQAVQFTS